MAQDDVCVSLEEWLAALLRSEAGPFPANRNGADLESVMLAHGVGSLVHDTFDGADVGRRLPDDVRARLKELALAETAYELVRGQEIREMLAELHAARIPALVMKGTALAYTLYPRPALRPRGDTDLRIRRRDREAADSVLRQRGYVTGPNAGGETAVHQQAYALDRRGVQHSVDVHWKLANTPLLGEPFPWEEAVSAATPVPELGPDVRQLGYAHAVVFACLHRIKHRHAPYYVGSEARFDPDRLIWLYDIRLLAEALAEPDWRMVLDCAERGRFRAVVADGLMAARRLVGAEIPGWVLEALTAPGAAEPSAKLLTSNQFGAFWADLTAFKGLDRARYLGDVLFPPGAYMREKYAGSRAPLAWLYLRRIFAGIGKRRTGKL